MMHERRAGVFALAAGLLFLAYATHLVLAGTLPNIAGTWLVNGDPSKRWRIDQAGTLVTLTNGQGRTAKGTFADPSTLDTDWKDMGGHRVVGTISTNLRRIDWSNGTYWTRASGSSTLPTPEPTPTPALLNVKIDLENQDSPIYMYAARLRNGNRGRTYSQCVSFRNVSNKVATNVDFSFVVKAHSGKVWADFGHVDRGTFTPPVNIDDRCWKGPLWPDPVVRLMSRETVRIKQVTFADATTWQPGLHFTRKYADGGSPIETP
jgi:hypothetical protein